MSDKIKLRLLKYYLIAGIIVLMLGPLSRKFEAIPVFFGDGFWTILVFIVLRCLLLKKNAIAVGVLALLLSYAVEISQLYKATWIATIRNSLIGGLILGKGFRWDDMLVYTITSVFCVIISLILEKKIREKA